MRPGDVIDGKYRIEVQLGEGGMGRVLAASHLAIGSTLAIKLLKAEALRYPEVPRRFMREARAMGRLRSEHVVRVMDVGQLPGGEPYMVMEMLHGCDLSTRIKQGPISPALAVEFIVQACEGLAEAHALGMVHRDVKPANLFITNRPNGAPLIKLLDFGIATAALGDVDHGLTSTQSVIGSPSYMSPEQLRAARDVDARSDIWSLGVTLYELLSGEQPFVAPTLTALSLQIVGEPHAPLDGIPRELNAVIDRCLAKDREGRFPNVAALAAALAPLFPNGRIAAEMVAGSLSQPVAPTLYGNEPNGSEPTAYPDASAPWSGAVGSRSVSPARAVTPSRSVRPLTSTTGLAAGESAPIPVGKRRRAWFLVGGATVLAAVAGFMIVARSGDDATKPASEPPRPAVVTRPTVEPIITPPVTTPTPPPVTAPTVTTPPAPPVTAPAVTTPPAPPVTAPAVTPPVATPPPVTAPPAKVTTPTPHATRPARRPKDPDDKRMPLEPDEYTKTPVATPPVTTPPKKTPCLPSDPRCGL